MASITLGAPITPPVIAPLTPGVGPVTGAAPVMLLEAETLVLAQAQVQAATAEPAAPAAPEDGAAMRPDQVFMARQVAWAAPDAATLAGSWRTMVRTYGTQLAAREQQARAGQLPTALLAAGQDPRAAHQPEPGMPADPWRFTVHSGRPQAQHLAVITGEPDQPPGRRRRQRAALRLELELEDGTRITVQAEALPEGIALELCAPGRRAMERLRALQPALEQAVARAGLQVLRWSFRDSLPPAPAHARLAQADAAIGLSLPVFRALAELALLLPAEPSAPEALAG